jgi:cell division protease FtsH
MIPPIEVPKSAANGSAPDEQEGAVILTPPGSGGDVHGDPTIDS